MQGYSPFDKPIQKLQASDLTVLRDVHEGWYVEYKSDLIESKKLAKAISAFANTYGGWLFFGVQECSGDDGHKAGSFPGISKNNLNIALQRLRQSTSEYLNPVPYFEHKILKGRCNDIELREDKVIIVVEIPESHAAPHIHKDGRIYRRVADSSEPKHETDRFILDQLWNRGETVRKKIREWVSKDPQFSKKETRNAYARLLLYTTPWRQENYRLSSLTSSDFLDIIKGCKSIAIDYDTFHTTESGFIARCTKHGNPHEYGRTLRIWWDLSCETIFLLPKYSNADVLSKGSSSMNFKSYKNFRKFIKILKENNHMNPKIIDFTCLYLDLLASISHYQEILHLLNIKKDFYFKMRFLNTRRSLPFIDSKEVLKKYQDHGLPIILDDTLTYPSGDNPESFKCIHNPPKQTKPVRPLSSFDKASEDPKEIKELEESLTSSLLQGISIHQTSIVFKQLAEVLGISSAWENSDSVHKVAMNEWMGASLEFLHFKDSEGNYLE